jgi:hypothetical protein
MLSREMEACNLSLITGKKEKIGKKITKNLLSIESFFSRRN